MRINKHVFCEYLYLFNCIYEMLQLLDEETSLLNSHNSMMLGVDQHTLIAFPIFLDLRKLIFEGTAQ